MLRISLLYTSAHSLLYAFFFLYRLYNSLSGLDLLKECRVSKAQAWQRTGRAGRQAAGSCYRMYTEQEFERFSDNTVPEILRYVMLIMMFMFTYRS